MSRYSDSLNPGCKVYVGNLGDGANRRDLEDAFAEYGPLKSVWVARHPPGFAFVEFLDSRDARDSIRGLHDTFLCGRRVEVEQATGEKRRNRGGYSGGGGGGGRYPPRRSFNDDKCYECGERGHFARECRYNSRRTQRSRSRSSDRYYNSRRYRSRSRSHSRSRSRSYHSPQRN